QQITQAWNASVSQSGTQVTATDLGWNATLGSAEWGFIGSFASSNGVPNAFALNGVPCSTA
ncbi:MAG: cellulose binding domain-containing protein, partial [Micromonosporaceae bacterium]|nr:cellulose binding domain-containing protein [Micromonosporaceae bacterium]